MGHPLVEEFCRVHGFSGLQPSFFNRCQRVFREEVLPQLDERERLLEENAQLKTQVEKLSKKKAEVAA